MAKVAAWFRADENTTLCMVGGRSKSGSKKWSPEACGRPPAGLDLVLDALFYRLRNAGPWRDLPDGFGPWRTIYGWYQRLARQGIWERLLRRLARRSKSRIRLVDGTHVVVHQCAANPVGGAQQQAMAARVADATPRSWR